MEAPAEEKNERKKEEKKGREQTCMLSCGTPRVPASTCVGQSGPPTIKATYNRLTDTVQSVPARGSAIQSVSSTMCGSHHTVQSVPAGRSTIPYRARALVRSLPPALIMHFKIEAKILGRWPARFRARNRITQPVMLLGCRYAMSGSGIG
eukprot:3550894-Rhodomonas_salina.1